MPDQRKSKSKPHLVIHIVLFAAFLGAIALVSIEFGPSIIRLLRNPEKFQEFIKSYGPLSALIYVLIQAAQIVIAFIPGEIVQIAGGYSFGTFAGTVYSFLGTLLGTTIVFFATRLFGYSLVKAVVPAGKLERFQRLLSGRKSDITVFLLFLIPGIPKDTLVYVAGLTPIKPLTFLPICLIARLPALWGSAYIGANLQEKDYLPVWIVSGIALVLFVLGVIFKDKIIGLVTRLRSGSGS